MSGEPRRSKLNLQHACRLLGASSRWALIVISPSRIPSRRTLGRGHLQAHNFRFDDLQISARCTHREVASGAVIVTGLGKGEIHSKFCKATDDGGADFI